MYLHGWWEVEAIKVVDMGYLWLCDCRPKSVRLQPMLNTSPVCNIQCYWGVMCSLWHYTSPESPPLPFFMWSYGFSCHGGCTI